MNYGNNRQFVSGVRFKEIGFFFSLLYSIFCRIGFILSKSFLFLVPMAPGEGERVLYLSDVSLSDPSVEVPF